MPLRIGTRGSPLALAQAEIVARHLREVAPEGAVEIVVIRTSGDAQAAAGETAAAGRGVFVKEIQEALLREEVDAAVHSMKDLPVDPPGPLAVGAVLKREDARDVFVSGDGRVLDELAPGSAVGTGSPRRVAQLRRLYLDLKFTPIRGNVETRLRKAMEGDVAGVVLARAGLVRLGLEGRTTEILPLDLCLPAPGQGAVGVECRRSDVSVRGLLQRIHHAPTGTAVAAERAFLRALGGGCRTPIAALGTVEGGSLSLRGFVGGEEGPAFLADAITGSAADPEDLGRRLASQLVERGAERLLQA